MKACPWCGRDCSDDKKRRHAMRFGRMSKPTYDEWRIRGGQQRYGLKIERDQLVLHEGFINGPYTLGESPVQPCKRSPRFDFAIFDGSNKPEWCGTKEECVELIEKWNDSYATFLMVRGTKAEIELYGLKP